MMKSAFSSNEWDTLREIVVGVAARANKVRC